MSAPHEVWVSSGHAADHLYAREDKVHVHAVRYLRADLVCGECADRNSPRCNAEVHGSRPGMIEFFRGEFSPACMAFEPKEE